MKVENFVPCELPEFLPLLFFYENHLLHLSCISPREVGGGEKVDPNFFAFRRGRDLLSAKKCFALPPTFFLLRKESLCSLSLELSVGAKKCVIYGRSNQA